MTAEDYAEFNTLRENAVAQHVGSPASVFVPVGGEGQFRLLFVGKATRGWADSEHPSYEDSVAFSRSFAADQFSNPDGQFFQFIQRVNKLVAGERGIADASTCFGWSNLVKIGDAKVDEPGQPLVRLQQDACATQLQKEVKALRPEAVIVTSEKFAIEDILFRAFGNDINQTHNTEEAGHVVKLTYEGIPIFWVRHPRGNSEEQLSRQASTINAALKSARAA